MEFVWNLIYYELCDETIEGKQLRVSTTFEFNLRKLFPKHLLEKLLIKQYQKINIT